MSDSGLARTALAPADAPPLSIVAPAAPRPVALGRRIAAAIVPGAILGFTLGHTGFGDFAEVHRMFTLADPRLFLTFLGGVSLTAVGMVWLARGRKLPRRLVRPHTVWGSVLFGLGWAICGACPGIVLVQLGEGRLYALWTLAGILGGTWLAGWWQRRFKLSGDGC